jgi:hypothetical protein
VYRLIVTGNLATMPKTSAVWITRENTTVRHIRGLLEGLEAHEAVDFAQIRIMVVPSDMSGGVQIPGSLTPNGQPAVYTDADLPPKGLLFFSDEE